MQTLKHQTPRFDVWPYANTFSHNVAFECCNAAKGNGDVTGSLGHLKKSGFHRNSGILSLNHNKHMQHS